MSRLRQRDTLPQRLSDAALGFHSSGDEMGSISQLKGSSGGDAAGVIQSLISLFTTLVIYSICLSSSILSLPSPSLSVSEVLA